MFANLGLRILKDSNKQPNMHNEINNSTTTNSSCYDTGFHLSSSKGTLQTNSYLQLPLRKELCEETSLLLKSEQREMMYADNEIKESI